MQGWIKLDQRQVALDLIHPLRQLFDDKPATLCTVCLALGINVPACQCTRQLVLVGLQVARLHTEAIKVLMLRSHCTASTIVSACTQQLDTCTQYSQTCMHM